MVCTIYTPSPLRTAPATETILLPQLGIQTCVPCSSQWYVLYIHHPPPYVQPPPQRQFSSPNSAFKPVSPVAVNGMYYIYTIPPLRTAPSTATILFSKLGIQTCVPCSSQWYVLYIHHPPYVQHLPQRQFSSHNSAFKLVSPVAVNGRFSSSFVFAEGKYS